MRRNFLGPLALFLAGTANAQLLGGGAHVGATVNVPNPVPQTAQTVDHVGTDVVQTTGATASRSADRVASPAKPVRVDAGASIRVERGTRCYYDDYYYDPAYRDGYYYCERSGSGVVARAGADPHK